MQVVAAGLLLLLCLGCGGDRDGGEEFRVYHLEAAIGPPASEGELRCGPPRVACPGVLEQPMRRSVRYDVRADPALTSEGIERASVRRSTDEATGAPVVVVRLTAQGRDAFARVTKRAARVGGRDQAWHHVAIVVGDEIVAFPEIDYDAHPDGFPDAPAIEIAAASDADARALVARLRGGAGG
jgi:preprotein translocase subunit SecD